MTYRRKDAYYRRARAAGYRARSAYKLSQLDSRFRLLRRGDIVVDLVAVDPLPASNLRLVSGDVRDPSTWRAVLEHLGRPADVVLSDLAPKLTGIRETDDARSSELVAAVLEMLPTILRAGGNLLIKLFMGGPFDLATAELRRRFEEFRTTRPEATRKASAEVYGVGRRYRGVAAS